MRNFYKKFFYIPKYEKVTEKVFLTRTALSVLSMLICFVVLCTGTWAYFTATISSEVTPIKAANYDLTIKLGEDVIGDEDKTYICERNGNTIYEFILEAIGNAQTGYCIIYINKDTNNPYYTDQIPQGASLTIQIQAAYGTKISFEPCWGTSSAYATGDKIYGGDNPIVCEGAENLTDAPIETNDYILHTVAEGETLAAIAELYQTPIAAVCEYNEIAEDTVLVAGQQIAIPKNFTLEEEPDAESNHSKGDDSTEAPMEETAAAEPAADTDETEEDGSSEPTEPTDAGSSSEENTGDVTEPPATTESTEPTTEASTEAADATTETSESSDPESTTEPETEPETETTAASEPETTESTSEASSEPDTDNE